MSTRRFLRRRIAALAVLGSLSATVPAQVIAQQALSRAEQATVLVYAGRNVDAVHLAEQSVEGAPPPEWQSTYRLAAQVCLSTMERGVEKRRDFVGAGFPVVAAGMASSNDHSAIFGTIGSRTLWMPR